MVIPVEPKGRSVGIFVRDAFVSAGRTGLVVADLFKEFKERDITKATYNSFDKYIYFFKRLEFIEATGKTEPSSIPELEDRVYYRMTGKGQIHDIEWSNPLRYLYPDWWQRKQTKRKRPSS